MKFTKILSSGLVLGVFAVSPCAFASKIHITNENAKDLVVYIQAEGSSAENLHWMELIIPAKESKDIVVTDKDMGGKATFYVQGKTNPLTHKGISANMDVKKNYTLTFRNLNIGTECVCELAKDQELRPKN